MSFPSFPTFLQEGRAKATGNVKLNKETDEPHIWDFRKSGRRIKSRATNCPSVCSTEGLSELMLVIPDKLGGGDHSRTLTCLDFC